MFRVIGISTVALALVACATEDTGRNSARAPVAATAVPTAAADSDSPSKSGVNIDPAIAKACGMPAPRFDFDSALITNSPPLDILAKCFISGPMKGKNLKLIGRADPRGTEDYNIALGQRRAGSVQNYLARQGLHEKRVLTISRGALDATGTNEKSWAEDRRVDVLLADKSD